MLAQLGLFLKTTLLITFVPNFAVLLGALYFGLARPLVNFDYVIVLFLFFLGFWRLGSLFLGVALCFEVLNLVSQIMPVFHFRDVFYLLKFFPLAPINYKLGLFSVVLLFLFSCLMLKKASASERSSGSILAILFFIGFYLLHTLMGFKQPEAYRTENADVIASQLVFSLNARRAGFVESFSLDALPLESSKYKAATEDWFSLPKSHRPQKLLLVVAESWGVSEQKIMDAVIEPIFNVTNPQDYSIEQGKIGFQGVTVEGELRELCRRSVSHFNLRNVQDGFTACLPHAYRAEGYQTVAVHGAVGLMYDRVYWYPKAGFEETVFFESHPWVRRCYSFPGACDFEVADKIRSLLFDSEKVFLYWLTLNSHAFYDERDIISVGFHCESYGIEQESAGCRNLKLQRQFFESLSGIVEALSGEEFEIIVVGDHPPIILDKRGRTNVFSAREVPWLHIKTRDH